MKNHAEKYFNACTEECGSQILQAVVVAPFSILLILFVFQVLIFHVSNLVVSAQISTAVKLCDIVDIQEATNPEDALLEQISSFDYLIYPENLSVKSLSIEDLEPIVKSGTQEQSSHVHTQAIESAKITASIGYSVPLLIQGYIPMNPDTTRNFDYVQFYNSTLEMI